MALDLEWKTDELEAGALRRVGAVLEEHRCRSEGDVLGVAHDAVAILVVSAPLTRRVLEDLPRCRVVAACAVGTDNIDLAAAAELGICVTNVPDDYGSGEVADHTVGLALASLRRIVEQRDLVRGGAWDPLAAGRIPRLAGATWDVVGFGRIGRAVGRRATAFGCRGVAYDSLLGEDAVRGAEPVPIERLLAESDVVSLHAPLTEATGACAPSTASAASRRVCVSPSGPGARCSSTWSSTVAPATPVPPRMG